MCSVQLPVLWLKINIKLLFPCQLQVTLRFAHGLEKAVSQQQGTVQNIALISVLFFIICSTLTLYM